MIGAVVIGRNEGDRLRACLESVLRLTDRVIYADSRSTDGSDELARSLGVEVIAVEGDPMTAARGRNAGYAELRRKWPDVELVQFVDGDCIVDPDWVETAARFLKDHPQAAAACGRRREAHPDASFYNRVIDREWDTPVGQADSCGGDALVRVAAFDSVGGFRSDLVAGEEPEFCSRLRAAGWQIWRLNAAMTEHDARIYSLGQWMRRAMRSGFGYAQNSRLYGRQMASALLWGLALPLAVLGGASIAREPLLLLLLPIVLGLQAMRIAGREGFTSFAWRYGALLVIAKVGEAIGILRYLGASRSTRAYEYKTGPQTERPVA